MPTSGLGKNQNILSENQDKHLCSNDPEEHRERKTYEKDSDQDGEYVGVVKMIVGVAGVEFFVSFHLTARKFSFSLSLLIMLYFLVFICCYRYIRAPVITLARLFNLKMRIAWRRCQGL